MDRPYYHLVFFGILLCASLSLCSDQATDQTGSDGQIMETVMCLLGNTTKELRLSCGDEAIMKIRHASYGYQEIPEDQPEDARCTFQLEDECGVKDPDFLDNLVNECTGTHECLLPVKRIFLNPCGKISDYVQVQIQCIPEDDPPQNVVDICGDKLGGESIARESGFITTPDYPSDYPPDESCMCSLSALQSKTSIKLTVMDMKVHSVKDDECVGDWLEYTSPGEVWGRGIRLCDAKRANTTYIVKNNIELHFRADSKRESRGFWIRYEGQTEHLDSVRIRVRCTQYHPSVNMETGQCLTAEQSQIYPVYMSLDCTKIGVIEVTGVEHWTITDIDNCPVATNSTNCLESVDNHEIMEKCMGQPLCTFEVASQHLPMCDADSNYAEVQYKCVADADEALNIVDVCGKNLGGEIIYRKSGFIESPNYPRSYPANAQCQCRLSTSEPETTIQLRVLDVEVTGDDTVYCKDDWLEHNVDPWAWGKGVKICDGLNQESILDTNAADVYLNFRSDGSGQFRGFWLQYSALRIEELTEVPVKVTCYEWLDANHISVSGEGPAIQSTTSDNDSSKNTALIVGLTVLIVLMLVLCIGMVLYKVRDSRKKYPPHPVIVNNPLDMTYNANKRYSTMNEQGASSDVRPRKLGGYQMQEDEYQRAALAANQLNLPASYVNPVYEGSAVA